MSETAREPIRLVNETPETVTLQRADYEALLDALEEAQDSAAVLEYRLAKASGHAPELLSVEEADQLIAGANPVRFWREKRRMTQRGLGLAAGVSESLLSEIETGTKIGSVETLRKLAHELKVDLDTLVP